MLTERLYKLSYSECNSLYIVLFQTALSEKKKISV